METEGKKLIEQKKGMLAKFRTFDNIRNMIAVLFYLGYIAVRLATKKGIMWLNWTILSTTLVYLVFFLVIINFTQATQLKLRGKFIYKWSKRGLLLLSALMTIANLFAVGYGGFDKVDISIAILTIFNFLLQILVAVVVHMISKKIAKIKAKTMSVASNVKSTFAHVKNMFAKKTQASQEEYISDVPQAFVEDTPKPISKPHWDD